MKPIESFLIRVDMMECSKGEKRREKRRRKREENSRGCQSFRVSENVLKQSVTLCECF